ncbi:MAG: penicillin-binding protein transpeptidase [Clostridiales bacterium]|nr:penicillin-binding protein transpeptidase [Clostridiales bacterium]
MALNLIIKFSTYVLAFYAVTFCILGYLACYGEPTSNKYAIKIKAQKVLIILTHLLTFFILFIQQPSSNLATLYVEQLLLILLMIIFYNKIYPKANKLLLNNVLFMLVVGFTMIQRLSPQSSEKQFLITAFCSIVSLFVPVFMVRLKKLYKIKYLYALIGIVLLGIVSIYGEEIYGAKNWIYVGNYSLQLSELVKVILVFYLAASLYRNRELNNVIATGILTCLYIGFLIIQKDLGTALILFFVYMIVIFVTTKNFYYVLFGFTAASFASVAAYFLFSHVQVRVFAWLNPWEDIAGKGYQITQSLFAIGSGGWFGLGLNKGMPNKIPFAQTDYVFSAIAEELGIVFAIALILIALNIVYIGYKISVKQMDPFKRLVSIGLTSLYGIQVFLVIGGVTKLIPHTGLTLPFISYGGSSIAASLIIFSLLESFSIDGSKEEMPFKYLKAVRYGFCAIFLILVINITYFMMFKSSSILVNSYNTRQDLLEETRVRGKILDANGNVLAESVLTIDGEYERIYPYNSMFSHVVGYSSKGKSGLEAYANFELLKSNQNIWDKLVSSISDEKLIANNVVSTLDADLQEVAYNALGDNKGAVAVIEVSTGKILAMVSKPDFNPNDIDLLWDDINTVEVTDSAILINRATQGLYPPGSTFKTLVALSFIRSNTDWNSYQYKCEGSGLFHNNRINCYGNRAHGTQTLEEAFANSCNTSFADIGTNMQIEHLRLSGKVKQRLLQCIIL